MNPQNPDRAVFCCHVNGLAIFALGLALLPAQSIPCKALYVVPGLSCHALLGLAGLETAITGSPRTSFCLCRGIAWTLFNNYLCPSSKKTNARSV